MLDLLHAALTREHAEAGGSPASFLHPGVLQTPDAERGRRAGAAGATHSPRRSAARRSSLTASAATCGSAAAIEQVLHVSLPPEQTWLGWLMHITQAPRPFALSVHVQATERYRERMAQKRRYRRLFGVNRGIEAARAPAGPRGRAGRAGGRAS